MFTKLAVGLQSMHWLTVWFRIESTSDYANGASFRFVFDQIYIYIALYGLRSVSVSVFDLRPGAEIVEHIILVINIESFHL